MVSNRSSSGSGGIKAQKAECDVYFGPHRRDGAKKMFSLHSRSACVSTIRTPLAKLFSYYHKYGACKCN